MLNSKIDTILMDISRHCKVCTVILKIIPVLVFVVQSSDLVAKTNVWERTGQMRLSMGTKLAVVWMPRSKACRLSLKTRKLIMSLRGGRSARAKRPPPKAIGEDCLLDIAQNTNDPNDNHDRKCDEDIAGAEPLPIHSTPADDTDNSTSILTQNDTGIVNRARSSAKLEEDRQLRELRASVLQRVAALFPTGVNITALALGNKDARSMSLLQRAILSMQEEDEDEDEDRCDVNSLLTGRAPSFPGCGPPSSSRPAAAPPPLTPR